MPHLEEAAGSQIAGAVGDSDPVIAVRDAVRHTSFDEVIVSTLPARVSRWLKRGVPDRLEELGLAVTVVTAPQTERRRWGDAPPHIGDS